jgi:hypothetical protein
MAMKKTSQKTSLPKMESLGDDEADDEDDEGADESWQGPQDGAKPLR